MGQRRVGFDQVLVRPGQARGVRQAGDLRRDWGRGPEGLSVEILGLGDHRQMLSLDLGVALSAAGDGFELLDVTGIQICAFNGSATLIHQVKVFLWVGFDCWLPRWNEPWRAMRDGIVSQENRGGPARKDPLGKLGIA